MNTSVLCSRDIEVYTACKTAQGGKYVSHLRRLGLRWRLTYHSADNETCGIPGRARQANTISTVPRSPTPLSGPTRPR